MTLTDRKEKIVMALNALNELQSELFQALIIKEDMSNAFNQRVMRADHLLDFAASYLKSARDRC